MMTKQLQSGRRWIKLGEVIANAQGGFASGERSENGVIQLRMNNVTVNGTFDWSSFIRVPADEEKVKAFRLEKGDVLFNNTNSVELVGKSAIFEGYQEPVVFSNHFTRLRTTNQLVPEYLFFWLRSQWQMRMFESICNRWVGQAAVQKDKLLSLVIPLPPLDEQKRITAILQEQLEAVEQARIDAEIQLKVIKKLPASFLKKTIPKEGTTPNGWRWVKLGEVCVEDRRIIAPNSTEAKKLPYLGLEHIESFTGKILLNPKKKPQSEGISTTFWFDDRHILYGKLRPYLNKVALPSFEGRCTTELIPILPKNVERDFLAWLIRREETVNAAMREKTGSRMPRANIDELFKLEVPLPPLAVQKRITATLREQLIAVEQSHIHAVMQLDIINKLPSALLNRAFAGEI
jgi:type I restriction enzyme S subunit